MAGAGGRWVGVAARMRAGCLLALALAGVPAAAVAADGDDETIFIVSRQEIGRIGVFALGPPGAAIAVTEQTAAGATVPITRTVLDRTGRLLLPRAASWSCESRVRRFVATVTLTDGRMKSYATDLRTPSCANRVAIFAPRRVAVGARAPVRVVDRWALGDRSVQICLSGAGLGHRCGEVGLTAGRRGLVRVARPRKDGQLRIAAGLVGLRVIATTAVGAARPVAVTRGPVLLTTGDSTIEGIDSVLDDRYGSAARIVAEAVPGTRLSGTGGDVDWFRRAARQAARLHPRVTVISLGGNEGFPMPDAAGTTLTCCGRAWTEELARRQRRLMQGYRQDGRGSVVWLLIAVPRDPELAEVAAAGNRAVRLAAAGLPHVRVLDLGAIFSPEGVFRESITLGGRVVRVRASDGLHLTAAGQAIAADAVRALVDRENLLDEAAGRLADPTRTAQATPLS